MRLFKPDVEKMEKNKDINGLTKALKDQDEHVRWKAAGALGNIGDARAVEPLIETLKDSVHDVRHVAAEALVKIGKPAAEPLSKTLKYEDRVRGSEVRRITAMVLGKIGDARAVEWLTSTANDPKEEPIVRWEAKEALKKIKEKKN